MIIDSTILTVIPPLVAAVLTYIVSNKKSRIEQAKVLADVQSHAIEQVRQAEEKMRAEIWAELEKVRQENTELRGQMKQQGLRILDLERQLDSSSQLRITLTEQVRELERLVGTYKTRIVELERKEK
jgi:chromosome segregation ATPase